MNNGIIFVGGVHGVGKTTLCNKIKEDLSIENYSSSQLISRYNSCNLNGDKQVRDLNKNQNILLKAIEQYIDENKTIILDGHFCLINKDNNIETIPIEVFKSLNLLGMILVMDEPPAIANRLRNRDSRQYAVGFINEFQNAEINWAKKVSEVISVKLMIVSKDHSKPELYDFINRCISEKD